MAAKIRANQYELHGDETTISFATTSASGRATFDYKTGETRLQFTGTEIRSENGDFGKAVTVTIDDGNDVGVSSIVLIIPEVSVRRPDEKVDVEALALLVALRSAGPAHQQYTVVKLQGTAAFVTF
jgi:hypothetical protein